MECGDTDVEDTKNATGSRIKGRRPYVQTHAQQNRPAIVEDVSVSPIHANPRGKVNNQGQENMNCMSTDGLERRYNQVAAELEHWVATRNKKTLEVGKAKVYHHNACTYPEDCMMGDRSFYEEHHQDPPMGKERIYMEIEAPPDMSCSGVGNTSNEVLRSDQTQWQGEWTALESDGGGC